MQINVVKTVFVGTVRRDMVVLCHTVYVNEYIIFRFFEGNCRFQCPSQYSAVQCVVTFWEGGEIPFK